MKTIFGYVEVLHVGGASIRARVLSCGAEIVAKVVTGAYDQCTRLSHPGLSTLFSPNVPCFSTEFVNRGLTPGVVGGRLLSLLGRAITLSGRGLALR